MSGSAARGPAGAPGDDGRLAAWAPAAIVILVVVFTTAVRLRLADVPLQRDEGEYAYAGRLILDGVPPYKLAYNMKFPGTYYAYAAILALFGRTAWGVHAGLAVVNAATTWMVFRLGRRLLGDLAGVASAAGFALLSLDRGIMGVWTHATHFIAICVVGGLLVLLDAQRTQSRSRFLAAGVLFGVAVLMKQHAVFYVALGAYLAFADGMRREPRDVRSAVARAALVAAGAAIPFAAVVAVCAAQGVLGRFWFWTFTYAGQYVSQVPLSQAPAQFVDGLGGVVRAPLALWLAAALGLVVLWTGRRAPGLRALVAGLVVASFLAICPGFFFRQHYFIVLLPAAALLIGVAAVWIDETAARVVAPRTARMVTVAVLVALCGQFVVAEREYLFTMTPRALSRARYGSNPFVEAPEIARYIHERTAPGDRVAVLGSEPEICFYADRIAASGYLYTYPLMEAHPFASRMQDEMIAEIEAARPAFLVLVQVEASWLAWSGSDRKIFEWGDRYTAQHYELVGIADILPDAESRILWDGQVRGYTPVSTSVVLTFRRRD